MMRRYPAFTGPEISPWTTQTHPSLTAVYGPSPVLQDMTTTAHRTSSTWARIWTDLGLIPQQRSFSQVGRFSRLLPVRYGNRFRFQESQCTTCRHCGHTESTPSSSLTTSHHTTAPRQLVPIGTTGATIVSSVLWGRSDLMNAQHKLVMSRASGGRYVVMVTLMYEHLFLEIRSSNCGIALQRICKPSRLI